MIVKNKASQSSDIYETWYEWLERHNFRICFSRLYRDINYGR